MIEAVAVSSESEHEGQEGEGSVRYVRRRWESKRVAHPRTALSAPSARCIGLTQQGWGTGAAEVTVRESCLRGYRLLAPCLRSPLLLISGGALLTKRRRESREQEQVQLACARPTPHPGPLPDL